MARPGGLRCTARARRSSWKRESKSAARPVGAALGAIRARPGFQSLGCLQLPSGRLPAALIAFQLVAKLLAFVQRDHARSLDRRDVDEDVRAAIVGLDEAEALS